MENNQVDDAMLYALIGERLKRHRIERGKTQAWLADRVGMLRTSITNIELGRQKAPLHVIYTLCAVLDVDPLDILPRLTEIRPFDDQNVAIEADGLQRLPPKTAAFVRGVMDDSLGRNQ